MSSTPLPFLYDGAPIHARAFALSATYQNFWRPQANDDAWIEHKYVPNCWLHHDHPRQVLWKPEDDLVVATDLSSSTPSKARALQLGQRALGATAVPLHVSSYPLAFRLPMRGPGQLVLPEGGFRCRRLWPNVDEPAHVETVDGTPIELRISGTRVGGDVGLCAEAFIGRIHETKKKNPRALIFSGDARHLLEQSPLQLRSFTSSVMDRLLAFAYWRQDLGLEVDRRALSGRRLGRVKLREDIADVEFAVRLPQPSGVMKFAGSYVTGLPGV